MTAEERWVSALEAEEREPTDWKPDLRALKERLVERGETVAIELWATEVAIVLNLADDDED